MLIVSELYIYPIKSLGGTAVASALVTDRGFQYDRRWMLVDEHNNFLTQRKHAQMALLQVSLTGDGLLVTHKIPAASYKFLSCHKQTTRLLPASGTINASSTS